MGIFDSTPDHGPSRDKVILDAVRVGNIEIKWGTVFSTDGTNTAAFEVFADSLKIDGIRVNVSAQVEQQIADLLGFSLLTPKLADLMWVQRAVTLKPHTRPITSATSAMIDHSSLIDADLAHLGYTDGIVATVGKHWVLDNDLLTHAGRAENYGWHFEGSAFGGINGEVTASQVKDKGGQYVKMIQGRGWAHDPSHVDYSQICCLVARKCALNGEPSDLWTILQDPNLAHLASHQGVVKVLRQPGVAELAPLEDQPSV